MNHMKYFLLLFSAFLFLGGCKKAKQAGLVQGKIAELKSEYAPDGRVAVFQLEMDDRQAPMVIRGQTQFPEALEEFRTFLDTSGIAYTDSVEILPAAELEGVHFGVVRVPVGNMRAMPRHQAEMATQAILGTPLRIWDKEGDWYRVQTPDGYLGWMDADGFTPMKVDQYRSWQDHEKVMVTGPFSVVFLGDTARGPIVTPVFEGQILTSLGGPVGGFHEVALPDGRHGYLYEYHAVPMDRWLASRSPGREAIVSTAMDFMGTSYLWGGTSPYGFDCSGFTKTVFYLNGLLLPRDASQQVHVGQDLGTSIDFAQWQPGDLLFFGRAQKGDQPEKITHVAIYTGNGKMIHASGNVKVESLRRADPDFAAHRYETFVRAKRVLGATGAQSARTLSSMPEYAGE